MDQHFVVGGFFVWLVGWSFLKSRQQHTVLPDLLSSQTYGCLPATPMAEWAGDRLNANAIGTFECTASPERWGEPCGASRPALPSESCLEVPLETSQSYIQRPFGLNVWDICHCHLLKTVVPELKGFGKLCAWC